MESTEMMHYGVKGMKWGVRRARKEYAELDRAKGYYKNAKKAYNRSVNYAGGNAKGLSLTRVKRAENEAAWDDVKRDKERLDRTKAEYKIQKKAVRDNAPAAAKLERGAKKVATAMAVVGGLYAYDKMYFGGGGTEVVKTGAKLVKAGASQVKNMMMDKAFAYTVVDSSGKILRRYN
jgi:hypothetical protein